MPKKQKTEAQLAKAKRSVLLNQVRNALIAGNEAQAYKICERHGYDIFEARLAPEYRNKSENWFVAKSAEIEALKNEPVLNPIRGETFDKFVDRNLDHEIEKQIHKTNSIFSPEVSALDQPVEPQSVTVAKITEVEAEEPAVSEILPETQPERQLDGRLVRGWPLETKAEIWGQPRNPQLMIALLPDQRKVSVYQSRYRKLKIFDKVTLRLAQPWAEEERFGDPVYDECSVRENTW